MRSFELLHSLSKIPIRNDHSYYSWSDIIEHSGRMRNDLFAIEVSAGAEVAITALFESHNVHDDLFEAYQLAFPGVATDGTLYERYIEMVERGPTSVMGFINNIKGKLAEIRMPEYLEKEFPSHSFTIAASQNQPGWDLIGKSPDGAPDILVQSKIGGASYSAEVIEKMKSDPDIIFAVSSEIRAEVLAGNPDLASQLADLEISNIEIVSEVEGNLDLLVNNFGIDVPDQVGGILSHVSEIILGIRLIFDIVSVERDFSTVSIDDRGRIHAFKALVLFQRFGVSTVCTMVGGAAGSILLPGIGTAGGGIGGAFLAGFLNKKLKHRSTELGMWLMRVTEDDMFYFKNKTGIDQLGWSLKNTGKVFSRQSN